MQDTTNTTTFQSLLDFFQDNALTFGGIIVSIIVAYTVLGSNVDHLEDKVDNHQIAFAAELIEIQEDVESGDMVDRVILERLSSIESKLDLLIDGKITTD